MAFQSRFEYPYGFAFLDDIHNFFPEFLYDQEIFSHLPVRWMRHRVQTLFPQAFARQLHLYGIYGRTTRQREFAEWISQNTDPGTLPLPIPTRELPATVPETSLPTAVPINPTTVPINPTAVPINPTAVPINPITSPIVASTTVPINPITSPIVASTTVPINPTTVPIAGGVVTTAHTLPLPASQTIRLNSANVPLLQLTPAQDMITSLLHGLSRIRSGEIRSTPVEPSIEPPTEPSREHQTNQSQEPPLIRQRTNRNRLLQHYGLTPLPTFPNVNLLQSLMTMGMDLDEDVGGQTVLPGVWPALWPDVVVFPTLEQIEAGSELIPPSDVPSETTCAICMEHDRRGEFNTPWRRLDCTHDFHQPCIDQWYTTSVNCPVCRHDIREPI